MVFSHDTNHRGKSKSSLVFFTSNHFFKLHLLIPSLSRWRLSIFLFGRTLEFSPGGPLAKCIPLLRCPVPCTLYRLSWATSANRSVLTPFSTIFSFLCYTLISILDCITMSLLKHFVNDFKTLTSLLYICRGHFVFWQNLQKLQANQCVMFCSVQAFTSLRLKRTGIWYVSLWVYPQSLVFPSICWVNVYARLK